jgi:hypothetical protein
MRNFEKLLGAFEVAWVPLKELVSTITASSKVKKNEYCNTGKIPIIDQGINFIAGYTDKDFAAVKSDEYVIFGDHSEHIKFVNFSFIQGADGLKILKARHDNTKYIYYAFLFLLFYTLLHDKVPYICHLFSLIIQINEYECLCCLNLKYNEFSKKVLRNILEINYIGFF